MKERERVGSGQLSSAYRPPLNPENMKGVIILL